MGKKWEAVKPIKELTEVHKQTQADGNSGKQYHSNRTTDCEMRIEFSSNMIRCSFSQRERMLSQFSIPAPMRTTSKWTSYAKGSKPQKIGTVTK